MSTLSTPLVPPHPQGPLPPRRPLSEEAPLYLTGVKAPFSSGACLRPRRPGTRGWEGPLLAPFWPLLHEGPLRAREPCASSLCGRWWGGGSPALREALPPRIPTVCQLKNQWSRSVRASLQAPKPMPINTALGGHCPRYWQLWLSHPRAPRGEM